MKQLYKDWLVASDIDGTLNSKLRTLPEINKKNNRPFYGRRR